MHLQESGEMYLESIYRLLLEHGSVRSIDVSEFMGYSKPSISRAMGLLKKGEFITIDKDGFISLTESGLAVADKIYERHRVLSFMLVQLGVDPEIAAADACKIEHIISDESFAAIKEHVLSKSETEKEAE